MPFKDKEKQREYQRQWEKNNRARGSRHRVWMFVFYQESADQDWREISDELGLPFCVSPPHDCDKWTARDERKNPKHKAGELKKTHYHGLVEYPQPVDYEQVKSDFAYLNTTNIKYAKSKASMALYLCHIKTKDKAQYDPADVLEFGGANWHDWCAELDDVHATMKEMRAFIRENAITDFCTFWDWCDDNNDEWSRALDLKCAYAIERYMKSYRAACLKESIVPGSGEGLSTTPSPGGAEPRTPNPDETEDKPRSGVSAENDEPEPEPEPESKPEPVKMKKLQEDMALDVSAAEAAVNAIAEHDGTADEPGAKAANDLVDAQEWDMFEIAFDSQSKIEGYIRSRRNSAMQNHASMTSTE